MFKLKRMGVALLLVMSALAPASAEVKELTIVVPNPSAINNYPLHVAVGEGYFEEEGLRVKVEAVNGSASVLQLLASGQGDIGQPGPAPLLAARVRGEDIVFIYNHFSRSVFGLVVPEESSARTPADLKGRHHRRGHGRWCRGGLYPWYHDRYRPHGRHRLRVFGDR